MYGFLLFVHIIICFSLVAVVLVQSGKGGGLAGGAFGGSAQTVFGGRGATDFITRATMVLGGAFFVTSLTLALMSTGAVANRRSLVQEEAKRAATSAPQPAPGQRPAAGPSAPGSSPTSSAPAVPAPGAPKKTGP
jgi:preprotein translocase subunit SecG